MTKRTTVRVLGKHGKRVRIMDLGDRYLVEWFVGGKARRKQFSRTREGKREAEIYADEQLVILETNPKARKPLTTREVFTRFLEVEAPSLRPATVINYKYRWQKWETFFAKDTLADAADMEAMDRFQVAMRELGQAPNQIGEHLKTVKLVYAWAQRRKLIAPTDVLQHRFKLAKNERRDPVAEYRVEDFEKVLRQLDPSSSRQWRAWVALMVLGHQGVRTRSALHLTWGDVDWKGQRVRWQREFDKLGRERWQPMRWGTYAALLTAKHWRERAGYEGPWVIFSEHGNQGTRAVFADGVYRQQTLIYHLHEAEKRAGVPRMPLRAAHGLRRMVAGEVLAETGDVKLAMDFIGDTDLRVMKRYLLKREDRLEDAAARLDDPKPYRAPYTGGPEVAGAGVSGEGKGHSESHWSDLNRRPQGNDSPPDNLATPESHRTADGER
jgi:integrase